MVSGEGFRNISVEVQFFEKNKKIVISIRDCKKMVEMKLKVTSRGQNLQENVFGKFSKLVENSPKFSKLKNFAFEKFARKLPKNSGIQI